MFRRTWQVVRKNPKIFGIPQLLGLERRRVEDNAPYHFGDVRGATALPVYEVLALVGNGALRTTRPTSFGPMVGTLCRFPPR